MAIAVIFILVVLLAFGLSRACGSDGELTPATTKYYQVGQWAETSRQLLTVTSPERTDSYALKGSLLSFLIDPMQSLTADAPPGAVFIIIEATVTNFGDGSLGIAPRDFSLKDSKGREYSLIGYKGHGPYPSMKLAPGRTASGKILFEVLKIASGLEVSLVLDGTPPVLAVWDLKW